MENKTHDWKEKKEEELEDKVTICKPMLESAGCSKHFYEEDYLDGESGWVHVQCTKCANGRYYNPKVSRFENGEICQK